ncbi:IpaD/SipD/SspD family type III secretion system needle tip protein [Kalamiella sp. sgz302252]|uniref:IpaD/SipD/SspD family type III secretion system needle tip protein n=1 Tax=Pantoea sp. sgz302252 TaxID=3341827 RepID=UPI0036D37448
MPIMTDISARLVNQIGSCNIAQNIVATDEDNHIPEETLLKTSSNSAAVYFQRVNNDNKLKEYLKAKNFAAFSEEVQSTGARSKLVAHNCKVTYDEISESTVIDSLSGNDADAETTFFAKQSEALSISDTQNAVTDSDVLLSQNLALVDSQPDTEIKAQLESVVEQYKDLKLENLQSEEIDQVITLSTDTSTASSKEISEAVAKAIGVMSEEYLNVFQDAVEKNLAFYKDFTDFIAKLSSYVGADEDKTTFNKSAFLKELRALMLVYPLNTVVPATTLYPPVADDTVKGTSKEDCVAWAKMMGLNPDSDNIIRELDDGTYVVTIDVSPLWAIENSANSASTSMNSAMWASFQAGLDIQKDTIQTAMQTLTQRYSNANSTFDNLVKVLSSVINSLLDCDKSFFNI